MRDGYRNYFSETWCAGHTGLDGASLRIEIREEAKAISLLS